MMPQDDVTLGMATKLVYRKWVEQKLPPTENSNRFEEDVIKTFYLFKRIQSKIKSSNRGGSR